MGAALAHDSFYLRDSCRRLGGCRKELRHRNCAIDCVVTSPPYFQLRRYGSKASEVGRETNDHAYVERLAQILTSLPVRERGSIWVNLADSETLGEAFVAFPDRLATAMNRRGWMTADAVAWAKSTVDTDGSSWGCLMPEPTTWRLNDNSG